MTIDQAAEAALTELLQMEVSLAKVQMLGDGPETWRLWRRDVTMATAPLSSISEEQGGHGPSRIALADLGSCISACEAAGVSVYFADLTRPEFNVAVARAISPELCHFKPRFGHSRLLRTDECDCRDYSPGAEPNPIPLLV